MLLCSRFCVDPQNSLEIDVPFIQADLSIHLLNIGVDYDSMKSPAKEDGRQIQLQRRASMKESVE